MKRAFKKVGHNTLILLQQNLIDFGLKILTGPILARTLGSTQFGQYNFITLWLQSLTSLAEFGLATVLNRDLAAKPEKTHEYLINSLICKFLLACPIVIAFILFTLQIASQQHPVITQGLRWGLILFGCNLIYSSLTEKTTSLY